MPSLLPKVLMMKYQQWNSQGCVSSTAFLNILQIMDH